MLSYETIVVFAKGGRIGEVSRQVRGCQGGRVARFWGSTSIEIIRLLKYWETWQIENQCICHCQNIGKMDEASMCSNTSPEILAKSWKLERPQCVCYCQNRFGETASAPPPSSTDILPTRDVTSPAKKGIRKWNSPRFFSAPTGALHFPITGRPDRISFHMTEQTHVPSRFKRCILHLSWKPTSVSPFVTGSRWLNPNWGQKTHFLIWKLTKIVWRSQNLISRTSPKNSKFPQAEYFSDLDHYVPVDIFCNVRLPFNQSINHHHHQLWLHFVHHHCHKLLALLNHHVSPVYL